LVEKHWAFVRFFGEQRPTKARPEIAARASQLATDGGVCNSNAGVRPSQRLHSGVNGSPEADPWCPRRLVPRRELTGLCFAARRESAPERGVAPRRDTGVEIEGLAVGDPGAAFAAVWAEAGPPLPPEGVAAVADARASLSASPGIFEYPNTEHPKVARRAVQPLRPRALAASAARRSLDPPPGSQQLFPVLPDRLLPVGRGLQRCRRLRQLSRHESRHLSAQVRSTPARCDAAPPQGRPLGVTEGGLPLARRRGPREAEARDG
jgi:hypothetical protein